jgi:phage internal scaffolding protein
MRFKTMVERVLGLDGRDLTAGQVNFASSISATSQEFLAESNINTIMRRYVNKGILPSGNPRRPMYGDFMNVGDFLEAQQRFLSARELFSTLPASLRQKLHNNPAEFLVWVADPANKDEAERHGLLRAATTPVTPAAAPAAPQSPPAGSTPAPSPS